MHPSFTIPVSENVLQKLIVELQHDSSTKFGSAPKGGDPAWNFISHGVSVGAAYNSTTEVLSVTIKSKPFFITTDMIQEGLTKEIVRLED